jgi:ribosomal protein S18 acetylase RimI-like enzyme
MPYQIRKAMDRDIACLGEIESAADGLFPAGRIPSLGGTYPIQGLLEALRSGLLLVAEADTVIVGFAASGEVEHALHLYILAVHPNYGRRGIGSNLVVGMIEESGRRGLTGVTLTTFADLEWNGPFYEKLGFRILARHETDSRLASILSSEKAAGMERRVAMLYRNAA